MRRLASLQRGERTHLGEALAVIAVLSMVAVGCAKPVENVLPNLPNADVRTVPDVPKPILPAEACVGLKPSAEKWQTNDAEVVEESIGGNESFAEEVWETLADVEDADGVDGMAFSRAQSNDAASKVSDSTAAADGDGEATPAPLGDVAGMDRLLPPDADAVFEPCQSRPATCVGAAIPEWELLDFQPRSCGYNAIYGLDVYKGHVTVVALLAAW